MDRHLEQLSRDDLLELVAQAAGQAIGLILVHDKRQRVHLVARKQDIEFDELGGTIFVELVVERGIALGAALELIEEVQDELGERHIEAHLDRFARQVDHVGCNAAVLDSKLHDGTRILGRADDLCLEVGLFDTLDTRGLG